MAFVLAVFILLIGLICPLPWRRSIIAEFDSLILIDGDTKHQIAATDIEGWNISKINAYVLQVFLTTGRTVELNLHGFYSEAKIVKILSELNLSRIDRPRPRNHKQQEGEQAGTSNGG